MADKTGIEWANATWNPVTGCAKVSAGCKNCYAEREWPRMTKLVPAYAGREFTDVRTHADRLDQPLRWKKPRKIFVNSMSDLFHEAVPDDFIDYVFVIMAIADHHVFQILTKRPERMLEYFSAKDRLEHIKEAAHRIHGDIDEEYIVSRWPLPNVWLGVSVENQEAADERIPLLLRTPASVRWVSAEPLLGPVILPECTGDHRCKLDGIDGHSELPLGGINWVVVGGESGPKARPMHPQWARSLRDQCAAAGAPFLFKQWGEFGPVGPTHHVSQDVHRDVLVAADGMPVIGDKNPRGTWTMRRVGKKTAGRLLDDVQHDGYPNEKNG